MRSDSRMGSSRSMWERPTSKKGGRGTPVPPIPRWRGQATVSPTQSTYFRRVPNNSKILRRVRIWLLENGKWEMLCTMLDNICTGMYVGDIWSSRYTIQLTSLSYSTFRFRMWTPTSFSLSASMCPWQPIRAAMSEGSKYQVVRQTTLIRFFGFMRIDEDYGYRAVSPVSIMIMNPQNLIDVVSLTAWYLEPPDIAVRVGCYHTGAINAFSSLLIWLSCRSNSQLRIDIENFLAIFEIQIVIHFGLDIHRELRCSKTRSLLNICIWGKGTEPTVAVPL